MTAFIDDHKGRFGVEPICRVLTAHGVKIAPSTYYAAKTRPASARAVRDALLLVEIVRVFSDRDLGRGLAGVRKVWRLLRRDPSTSGCSPTGTWAGVWPTIHSRFGASAVKSRLTRSGGRGAVLSDLVVTNRRPRRTPARPAVFISRATVQRATGLHLRADLVGDGVHSVRVRCVLPPHRRLAHRHLDADRAAPGCVGGLAVGVAALRLDQPSKTKANETTTETGGDLCLDQGCPTAGPEASHRVRTSGTVHVGAVSAEAVLLTLVRMRRLSRTAAYASQIASRALAGPNPTPHQGYCQRLKRRSTLARWVGCSCRSTRAGTAVRVCVAAVATPLEHRALLGSLSGSGV